MARQEVGAKAIKGDQQGGGTIGVGSVGEGGGLWGRGRVEAVGGEVEGCENEE